MPLETDLTTPLAYFLSHTDLDGIEYTGLLRADKVQDRAGIYMFEPYQPGKIPVVMVHGLLSSPLTWTPLFNDLRADPVLRQQLPVLVLSLPDRQSLPGDGGRPAPDAEPAAARARSRSGATPALDQMVLVGHSMGGLVSRLMTVDSGDDFWHLVSTQPFDTAQGPPGDPRRAASGSSSSSASRACGG